jgi:hypothetical protein
MKGPFKTGFTVPKFVSFSANPLLRFFILLSMTCTSLTFTFFTLQSFTLPHPHLYRKDEQTPPVDLEIEKYFLPSP